MEVLKSVVEQMAKKAAQATNALEAMQFAQAALNTAHAAATLHNMK